MTKENILNYYRKLIEKSRVFCAGVVRKLQSYCHRFMEKARSFYTGLIRKFQSLGKLIKHIHVKRIDIFLVVVAAALLVFFFVNRTYKTVSESKRININISWQCGDLLGKDTVDSLIREFEEQHPELRIQEAVDDSVDIVFFDDSEFGSLINSGVLASPDSYRPLVSFMDLFVYNIDILKAANLDRPPKTRAEFLTAARAVKAQRTNEAPPFSAFALGLSPADPLALRRDFYPWIWASGVDIQSIDLGDDPALPRAVTDVIALFGQLNSEELLAPGTFEKTGAERLQEFAEGKIAMMTISARDIPFLQNSAPGITFDITALPMTTQGRNRLGLSRLYAGISGASAVPDEAEILLSFLVEKSNVLAEALSAIPSHLTVGFAGEYIENSELYSKARDIFEAADIVRYKPGEPSEEAFNRLIREKLAEAFK